MHQCDWILPANLHTKNHENPYTFVEVIVNKMLSYRRETAL